MVENEIRSRRLPIDSTCCLKLGASWISIDSISIVISRSFSRWYVLLVVLGYLTPPPKCSSHIQNPISFITLWTWENCKLDEKGNDALLDVLLVDWPGYFRRAITTIAWCTVCFGVIGWSPRTQSRSSEFKFIRYADGARFAAFAYLPCQLYTIGVLVETIANHSLLHVFFTLVLWRWMVLKMRTLRHFFLSFS